MGNYISVHAYSDILDVKMFLCSTLGVWLMYGQLSFKNLTLNKLIAASIM